jgi:hypothetical protein
MGMILKVTTMITLRVFHKKTFAAILSEKGTDFLWNSPYDLTDLYSTDALGIAESIISFSSWVDAQKYLVGARMVASSLLIEKLECKPEVPGSKGLTPSESRNQLLRNIIDKILPIRGHHEALLFVSAMKAFHDPYDLDDKDILELKEAFDQHSDSSARLVSILKANEFDAEFRMEQALMHVNDVLLPEGRVQEAKSVLFHVLSKGYVKTPRLVTEAERLYKAAKMANAIILKEQAKSEPDFKRGVPTTPKRRLI